jgi:TetR/AcrR family transcriptional repressor of nem operon
MSLDFSHTSWYVKDVVQVRRSRKRAGGRQTAAGPPGDASQRERAKAGTRAALIEAAMAEFASHGLVAPSLDAICARAGFTRGAFYVHFRDREDLVAAVMERALGAFLDAIIATGEQAHDLERTVRRFEDSVGVIAQLRAARPRGRRAAPSGVPFHRILEACERSPEIRARFVALLGEAAERVAKTAGAGQSAGVVRSDVSPAALGAVLVALALGFVAAIEVGAPFDTAAARRAVLALIATPT